MTPDQRAARAAALLRDELVTGTVTDLKKEATERLLSPATPPERLQEARQMVWALDAVIARLQSYVDEQLVIDRHNRGHRR